MRSLVLIGHGSHQNAGSAGAVYHYAELIRVRGLYDEVIEGYWKEEPSLRQVLKTTATTDVTVIPMFISEGYFTETVIPRELGLGHQGPVPPEGIARVIGGRTVRYTPPFGVHPSMTEVILARAREALHGTPDARTQDAALIVLGHGTTRNAQSRRVIDHNADLLRQNGHFAEVHALFLDEDPRLTTWPQVVRAARVVIVPFFAAEGWHTQQTIPQELRLTGDITHFPDHPHGPQTVHYTKPVGTHPSVADVILHLAREASTQSSQGGDLERTHLAAWNTALERARHGLRVGELLIAPQSGVFELRHSLDEGIPGHELPTLVTAEGVRDRTRLDDAGRHRPLKTQRNLPRGWRAVLNEVDLPRALHYVYPAVTEETYAYASHTLRPTPWPTTARRQTGIYAKVQKAAPEQVEQVARRLCSTCLRTPLWAGQKLGRTFLEGVPGGIPCAEACTLLVAEVRDAMSGKREQEQE